jgi:hypothetical protein
VAACPPLQRFRKKKKKKKIERFWGSPIFWGSVYWLLVYCRFRYRHLLCLSYQNGQCGANSTALQILYYIILCYIIVRIFLFVLYFVYWYYIVLYFVYFCSYYISYIGAIFSIFYSYISYIGIIFYYVYSYSYHITFRIFLFTLYFVYWYYITFRIFLFILYFVYWYSHYVSYLVLYYIILYYIILYYVFNVYLGKYIKYIISVVLCFSDPTFDIDELLCFYGVYRNPPSDRVCFFQFHNFSSLWQCSLLLNPSEPSVLPHCRRIVCM